MTRPLPRGHYCGRWVHCPVCRQYHPAIVTDPRWHLTVVFAEWFPETIEEGCTALQARAAWMQTGATVIAVAPNGRRGRYPSVVDTPPVGDLFVRDRLGWPCLRLYLPGPPVAEQVDAESR